MNSAVFERRWGAFSKFREESDEFSCMGDQLPKNPKSKKSEFMFPKEDQRVLGVRESVRDEELEDTKLYRHTARQVRRYSLLTETPRFCARRVCPSDTESVFDGPFPTRSEARGMYSCTCNGDCTSDNLFLWCRGSQNKAFEDFLAKGKKCEESDKEEVKNKMRKPQTDSESREVEESVHRLRNEDKMNNFVNNNTVRISVEENPFRNATSKARSFSSGRKLRRRGNLSGAERITFAKGKDGGGLMEIFDMEKSCGTAGMGSTKTKKMCRSETVVDCGDLNDLLRVQDGELRELTKKSERLMKTQKNTGKHVLDGRTVEEDEEAGEVEKTRHTKEEGEEEERRGELEKERKIVASLRGSASFVSCLPSGPRLRSQPWETLQLPSTYDIASQSLDKVSRNILLWASASQGSFGCCSTSSLLLGSPLGLVSHLLLQLPPTSSETVRECIAYFRVYTQPILELADPSDSPLHAENPESQPFLYFFLPLPSSSSSSTKASSSSFSSSPSCPPSSSPPVSSTETSHFSSSVPKEQLSKFPDSCDSKTSDLETRTACPHPEHSSTTSSKPMSGSCPCHCPHCSLSSTSCSYTQPRNSSYSSSSSSSSSSLSSSSSTFSLCSPTLTTMSPPSPPKAETHLICPLHHHGPSPPVSPTPLYPPPLQQHPVLEFTAPVLSPPHPLWSPDHPSWSRGLSSRFRSPPLRSPCLPSRSPSPKLRSQRVPLWSQSPSLRSQSPPLRSQSPKLRSQGPPLLSQSPPLRSQSPSLLSQSPNLRSQSPPSWSLPSQTAPKSSPSRQRSPGLLLASPTRPVSAPSRGSCTKEQASSEEPRYPPLEQRQPSRRTGDVFFSPNSSVFDVFSFCPSFPRLFLLLLVGLMVFVHPHNAEATSKKKHTWYNVEAITGRKAILPCELNSLEGSADLVYVVLWYRNDEKEPIYSFDKRPGRVSSSESRHIIHESLRNRAKFLIGEVPALEIDPISGNDEANYTCRVDFRIATSRTTRVALQVVVPPNDPVLRVNGDVINDPLLGPLHEGQALTLTCSVTGGDPSPRVVWTRNGKIIDAEPESRSPTLTVNELSIKRLTRPFHDASLACHASNNNVTTPKTTAVTITMNLRPLVTRLVSPPKELRVGQRYEILCRSAGARPQPNITWTLGNIASLRTIPAQTEEGINVTTSKVEIEALQTYHGQRLTCTAKSSIFPASPLSDSFVLNVTYPPIVRMELGSGANSTVRENQDVYFNCIVDSNPPTYKITWYHEGKPLDHDTTKGVIISEKSLALRGVTRTMEGSYVCSASNVEGDTRSKAINLHVYYSPVCASREVKVYATGLNHDINVTCAVRASPEDVKFSWVFNNSVTSERIPGERVISNGLRSAVQFTARGHHDYGTLQCWALNSIGKMTTPCYYNVIPAGRPDSPVNCSVINKTYDSLVVGCDPGFDGGLRQSFLAKVSEANTGRPQVNVTSLYPRFTVQGLAPGLDYVIRVVARNTLGESDAVSLEAFTYKMAENRMRDEQVEDDPSTSAGVAGVLLGVLALVVVGLLVLVLVGRSVVARRRRRQRGDGMRRGGSGHHYVSPSKTDEDVDSFEGHIDRFRLEDQSL